MFSLYIWHSLLYNEIFNYIYLFFHSICLTGVSFERDPMESNTNPTESRPVIAIGCPIGDGALFLQVVDIAVHPAHQRKGLGK